MERYVWNDFFRERIVFRKLQTLPGYVFNQEVHEITIEPDGTVNGEKEGVWNVENQKTKVEFIKCDQESGKKVVGGSYQILDLSENIIAEWNGTKDPYIAEKLLVDTEYIYREVKAAEGYLAS